MSQGDPIPRQYGVPVETVAMVGGAHKTISVGVTAVLMTTGLVENRTAILIQSDSANTQDMFLGYGSGVTAGAASGGTTRGFRLTPGQSQAYAQTDAAGLALYAIANGASQYVTIMENR